MFIINLVKKVSVFISSSIAYLSLPFVALAATDPIRANLDPCTSTSGISQTLCDLGKNPANTLRNIIIFFTILAVVIALLYLLYGGIKWITSGGDKTEVDNARKHIIAAIVGLVVVFLAIFMLSIALAAFGIKIEQLVIPDISSTTP